MGEGGAPRITSEVQFPGMQQVVSNPEQPVQAPPVVPAAPVVPMPRVQTDPMSRPYKVPSGGLYYGATLPTGDVVISPTRGAQEEILAGAKDNKAAALSALRHVASQCVQLGALPFNDLLLFDFTAILLHWLALSSGVDELSLKPVHKACNRATKIKLALGELPCTTLRRAEPGEDVQWAPRTDEDEDDDPMEILRDMDGEEAGGPQELVIPDQVLPEPFLTDPLPHTNDVIGFRYHRVHDVIRAEEYAARAGSKGTGWHNFLTACQLVSLNGQPFSGRLEAVTWLNAQPSPVLHGLRDDISLRDFGYDVTPRLKCQHCGGRFRVRLPLDGSLFRRHRRR